MLLIMKYLTKRGKELFLQRHFYNPASLAGFGTTFDLKNVAKREGYDISTKFISNWLESQPAYYLHKQKVQTYKRRKTLVPKANFQYQADLVVLFNLSKYNNGFRYIITCIDCFSRYAYAIPLKTKKPTEIVVALKKIFGKKQIKFFQTDRGTEFWGSVVKKYLKERNIHHFSTSSETKAAICERFNRTLKTRLFKYFTGKNTLRWVDILDKILYSYNNRYHRSIKMPPSQVTKRNEHKVRKILFGNNLKSRKKTMKIGDSVIIAKQKKSFDKGYLPGWKKHPYTIADVYATIPVTYKLMDENNLLLKGVYYHEQVQKIQL